MQWVEYASFKVSIKCDLINSGRCCHLANSELCSSYQTAISALCPHINRGMFTNSMTLRTLLSLIWLFCRPNWNFHFKVVLSFEKSLSFLEASHENYSETHLHDQKDGFDRGALWGGRNWFVIVQVTSGHKEFLSNTLVLVHLFFEVAH